MAGVGPPGYIRGMADEASALTAYAFHAQPGTEGWHVLYGGAQTIFPTGSFAAGAALVARIIEVTAPLGREPDIDLRPDIVAVVTAADRRGRLTTTDAEVARRISAAAAELGLHPDPERLHAVQIGVAEAGVDTSAFWLAVLGYEEVEDVLADPLRRWPRLWHDEIAEPGRGRTHLDVAVPNALATARVEAMLGAGGRLAERSSPPDWWTLASPDNHGIDIAAWGDVAGGPDE